MTADELLTNNQNPEHKRRESSRSLLVLHQGALGDFILALSVIQSVREYLNASHVVTVANAPSAQLAAGRSVVDCCLSPESVHLHELFAPAEAVHPSLRDIAARADWILNFLGDEEDITARSLRGITRRPVVSIDPRPTDDTIAAGRHITRQWTDAIRAAGWNVGDPNAPLIHWKHGKTRQSDRPRHVMIHPGSGSFDKCWPAERFLAMADAIHDAHITWLIGPAEVNRNATNTRKILDYATERGHECVVTRELTDVVDRMVAADVYVGNDAGTTHLAAAVGVPVVAIYRTTDPRVWRPLNPNVTIVTSDADVDEDVVRSVKRHLEEG